MSAILKIAVVALCGTLFAAALLAQTAPPSIIQGLLPPEAKIIETANLTLGPGKARALVLWMEKPERVAWRDDPATCGCGRFMEIIGSVQPDFRSLIWRNPHS